MKTLYALALVLGMGYTALGQRVVEIIPASPIPIDSTTSTPLFREVVQVDDAPVADLIARARTWVVKTYKSANDVIQQYDPAQGILIAKGSFLADYIHPQPMFNIKTLYHYDIFHTITVEARQGRCRITVDGLTYRSRNTDRAAMENIYSSPKVYVARVYPDSIELALKRRELETWPMVGAGWARRMAPIYTAGERNRDKVVYEQIVTLIADLKTALKTKDKDW